MGGLSRACEESSSSPASQKHMQTYFGAYTQPQIHLRLQRKKRGFVKSIARS